MKNVMIVDDDQGFIDEMAEVLRSSGYEVATFLNGDELFLGLTKKKPDLILLDLKISGGSGFKIADQLKTDEKTKNIPIIAITGVYIEEDQMIVIKGCGFAKRLIKPIKPLDVIAAIEDII